MAIKTQLRPTQMTGSLGTAPGQINDNESSVGAGQLDSPDLSVILSHMASSIKRLHGGGSFHESVQGQIKMIDNNAAGFEFKSLDNKSFMKFVTTDNSESIDIGDDAVKLRIGTGADLRMYHDGTNSYIENVTGELRIDPKSGERGITAAADGAVTLYYDNVAKLATSTGGITVTGAVAADSLNLGDDEQIVLGSNADYSIEYDENGQDSLQITAGVDGADFKLKLAADRGDDAADVWQVKIAGDNTGKLTWGNDIASQNTYVEHFSITPNSTVGNSVAAFAGGVTIAGDLTVSGTTTTVDTTNLQVKDKNILINDGGGATSAAGAGLDIEEGGSVTGYIRVADDDRAKFDFKAPNGSELKIAATAAAELTVNGNLAIESASVINQDLSTDSTAVVFAGLSLADGNITNVGDINADSISVDDAAAGLKIDFSGANTTKSVIALGDNLADALTIDEGSNSYMKFITTDGGERVDILKPMQLAGGEIDLIHATENAIKIPDNKGDALTIKQGGNFYMKFVTTDGSEAITAHQYVQAQASLAVANGNTSAGYIEFIEDSDNGSNGVKLMGPASTADITLTLPNSVGSAGQVLQSDGSGVLSFVNQSAGAITAKKFWLTPTGSVKAGDMVGTTNNVNWSTYGGGSDKQIDLSSIAHVDEGRVVDVFVNGMLMLSGSEADRAGGNADYALINQTGVDRVNTDIKFAFNLEADDTVVLVARS